MQWFNNPYRLIFLFPPNSNGLGIKFKAFRADASSFMYCERSWWRNLHWPWWDVALAISRYEITHARQELAAFRSNSARFPERYQHLDSRTKADCPDSRMATVDADG